MIMTPITTILQRAVLVAATLSIAACEDNSTDNPTTAVQLKNHSSIPALVKTRDVSGLELFSLISSDDTLSDSPGFIFGGSADGSGLIRNADGTYTMIVNHEDNFSVSRITLDKTFKPTKGEYLVNSDNGRWRLCSATLATMEEHGFGPLYLTCGESGEESMTHGINPLGGLGQSNPLNGLGHWSAENAVPLPKSAYSGRTVILIGDDDSGNHGGQLAMYLTSTVGDMNNGSLYVLTRNDNNVREMDMVAGQSYPVTFRKIDNHTSMTGAQINAKSSELSSIKFGRTEDIDYRKNGVGREVYFNVTGQASTGANADNSRTKYGRVYRLTLDAADPTKGALEVVLDGDNRSGIAGTFQNVDNICVTQNYIYIQEDPNGYGDETHDSYLYQYDIAAKTMKVVFELDHHRGDAKFNVGGESKKGAWEYGSLVDISDKVGIANTFMLCIQPHTWTGARYRNPDGGSIRPDESQASQIIIVKGLAR